MSVPLSLLLLPENLSPSIGRGQTALSNSTGAGFDVDRVAVCDELPESFPLCDRLWVALSQMSLWLDVQQRVEDLKRERLTRSPIGRKGHICTPLDQFRRLMLCGTNNPTKQGVGRMSLGASTVLGYPNLTGHG